MVNVDVLPGVVAADLGWGSAGGIGEGHLEIKELDNYKDVYKGESKVSQPTIV